MHNDDIFDIVNSLLDRYGIEHLTPQEIWDYYDEISVPVPFETAKSSWEKLISDPRLSSEKFGSLNEELYRACTESGHESSPPDDEY